MVASDAAGRFAGCRAGRCIGRVADSVRPTSGQAASCRSGLAQGQVVAGARSRPKPGTCCWPRVISGRSRIPGTPTLKAVADRAERRRPDSSAESIDATAANRRRHQPFTVATVTGCHWALQNPPLVGASNAAGVCGGIIAKKGTFGKRLALRRLDLRHWMSLDDADSGAGP
jgi:hypothetical protein